MAHSIGKLWALAFVAALLPVAIPLSAQRTPNPDFRETAIVPYFHKKTRTSSISRLPTEKIWTAPIPCFWFAEDEKSLFGGLPNTPNTLVWAKTNYWACF